MKPSSWTPPKRMTTAVLVAIDPPRGWAIWHQHGIVAAGQHKSMIVALRDMKQAYRKAFGDRRIATMAIVEKPFGGENTKSLVQNALATGWCLREVAHMSSMVWDPMANQWRKWVGIRGDREQAKKMAIALANTLAALQGISGDFGEDGSEAVCICLAAWLRFGHVVDGDLAHKWIQKYGIPYTGGISADESIMHTADMLWKPDRRAKQARFVKRPSTVDARPVRAEESDHEGVRERGSGQGQEDWQSSDGEDQGDGWPEAGDLHRAD